MLNALREVIEAWEDFKLTHNLNDPKLRCCPATTRLFLALAGLEEEAATVQHHDPRNPQPDPTI